MADQNGLCPMQTKSKSCKEKKLIASLRERLQHAKMIFFGSRALFPDLIVKKIGSRSFLYSKKCYFSSRAIRSFLSETPRSYWTICYCILDPDQLDEEFWYRYVIGTDCRSVDIIPS